MLTEEQIRIRDMIRREAGRKTLTLREIHALNVNLNTPIMHDAKTSQERDNNDGGE